VTTHPDDEFHPPTSDDPEWTETMWFAFAVPERDLSMWTYSYSRVNLGVVASGVYVWNARDQHSATCPYAKMFWHLPFPTAPLSDVTFANGLRYRAAEPLQRYEVGYDDPDGDALHVDLTFDAIVEPVAMQSHIDQPGRVTGTITLDGDRIEVDGVGFRDRSWGVRRQFGEHVMGPAEYASYTYGTTPSGDGFFTLGGHFAEGPTGESTVNVHGYLRRDGELSMLASGRREVLERSAITANPTRVAVEGTDQLGRSFRAEGPTRNGCGIQLNPNLWSMNSLVAWDLDGTPASGEDHDNWSPAGFRRFFARR
jgi:hypothetical protein